MKKGSLAIAAVAAFLLLAGVVAAAMPKSGQVPDAFTIDNSKTFVSLTKPTVPFNHAKHFGQNKVACDHCHHVYKDKVNTWKEGDPVARCAACHKSPAQNEEGGMLALMNAFHKKCRDCHRVQRKGPTACEECHTETGKEPAKKLW